MLELCKEILTKVSFDKLLFQKELRKALSWLKSDEIAVFKEWCINRFGNVYPDVIKVAFSKS
ncbi:MAG: hypothetical protein WDZ35_03145 [Crocinitomicaceae bacterium]